MLPFQPEEFGLSVRIDNRLAAVRVASGESIELYEVIELMAACRCFYDFATLAARELTRIQDCLALWSSMRDQFTGLCQAWESVPGDGELTTCYRAELRRLKGLCEDRRGMYVVTVKERLRHAKDRGDAIESFGVRSEITPDGYRSDQSGSAHVYTLGHF